MNNIPKGLSLYRTLLADIGDKDRPVMNDKNFEIRSMEAFHYTLKCIETFTHKKDNKQEEELLKELNQTVKEAIEIKDQFLENDGKGKKKRHLISCVCNQIDGLIFFYNTAKTTSQRE